MRKSLLVCALLFFGCNEDAARPPGTTGTTTSGGGDGGGGGGDLSVGPLPNGTLSITPLTAMLAITPGGPAATQAFVVNLQGNGGGANNDVTLLSAFALDDPTLGTMSGATFTTSGVHGGTSNLTATYNGLTATAVIDVAVSGSFHAPDCLNCPTFPSDTAPTCAASVAAPSLVYPPDGVLLPPNMEQLAVHYLPVAGAQQYEIDFSNARTDVRIVHKCTTLTNGGCILDVDPSEWDYIAKTNRGGDAVTIKVRATPDNACVTVSPVQVNINFAEVDVSGGIYYWKSTVSANGTGGQIWRKSFGDVTPEEQITNVGGVAGTCFGCHFLSRDGKRMAINGDDDDSDDEYSDVNSGLVDIASKMFITTGISRAGEGLVQPPGFQTFSPDHTTYLGSDGEASGGTPNAFFAWNGDTGAAATPATVSGAMGGQRVTMPDWSADDKNVVYVVPTAFGSWPGRRGAIHVDDDHVLGGSLWAMPRSAGMFGTPVPLVQSQGENNYYPGYSPDGEFIIFNRVDKQTSTAAAANDSFSNPKARVWILPTTPGAMGPIDCTLLNGTGDLSNSWPRWSPFIQTYKGNKLLWVTFSSTRDYGVRIKNSAAGLVQCYPPDSTEDPTGTHGQAFPANCKQPQIWMAAINLSAAENAPADPSFPAFWLPFQDATTHNHTAQWTTTVVNMPTPADGGACIGPMEDCTKNPNGCCAGLCLSTGTCGVP